MKVARNEAWHVCILCDDMLVVHGLCLLHLVNIRIKKLKKTSNGHKKTSNGNKF